jgi:hypothetical protein
MGGFGSGRNGGKPIADSALQIDIGLMLRTGHAKAGDRIAGTLHWSCRGQPIDSVGYVAIMDEPGKERLELSYWRGQDEIRKLVKQTIALCHTVPRYGGKRWWMICPYQHCRVGKLYMPDGGDRFASRKAWGLGYQSQRIAPNERPLEALFRLQKKLDCPQGLAHWPTRPKGMWRRTFDRFMVRYQALEIRASADFMAMANRLSARQEWRH